MLIEGDLVRVGAVLRTPAANTTIPFEALLGVDSVLVGKEMREQVLTGEQGWWAKVLLRLRPGASPEAVTAALQQAVESARPPSRISSRKRNRAGRPQGDGHRAGAAALRLLDHQVAGDFCRHRRRSRQPRGVRPGLGAIGGPDPGAGGA